MALFHTGEALGGGFHGFGEGGGKKRLADADTAFVPTLVVQWIIAAKTGDIIDEFLGVFIHRVGVMVFARGRRRAIELPVAGPMSNLGTRGVPDAGALGLEQFPGAGAEAERFAGQTANGADIDDIAAEDVGDGAAAEGSDVVHLAAGEDTHHVVAGDLVAKADAARAHDAPVAFDIDEGVELGFLKFALLVGHACVALAILHAVALEHAFATAIADRTIKRVVGQEEFHHAALAIARQLGIGEDMHPGRDGRLTGDGRLGQRHHLVILSRIRQVDFHEAEAAVPRHAEGGMPAVMGNVNAFAGSHVDDGLALFSNDGAAINDDFHIFRAGRERRVDTLIRHRVLPIACGGFGSIYVLGARRSEFQTFAGAPPWSVNFFTIFRAINEKVRAAVRSCLRPTVQTLFQPGRHFLSPLPRTPVASRRRISP